MVWTPSTRMSPAGMPCASTVIEPLADRPRLHADPRGFARHGRLGQRAEARAAGPDRHHHHGLPEPVEPRVGLGDPGPLVDGQGLRAVLVGGQRVGRAAAQGDQGTGGGRDRDPAHAGRQRHPVRGQRAAGPPAAGYRRGPVRGPASGRHRARRRIWSLLSPLTFDMNRSDLDLDAELTGPPGGAGCAPASAACAPCPAAGRARPPLPWAAGRPGRPARSRPGPHPATRPVR